jgi:dTDP-glucose 4,6-dehydratase
MKRILITGGAGSIGINVIGYIMEKTDWEVVVLDSFRHKGYRDRITRLLKDNPEWTSRIKDHQHDLVCPVSPDLIMAMGKIDYILHLAALSDVFFSVENPVYTIQNNINSTLSMLEYARIAKPEQFIYFSTDEVYGPVKKGESHSEWDPHKPSNAYAASKAACEDICYSYWRSYGVPVIITNTMNNFGIMQSSSKFPVMVQKKLEKGETVTIHGNEQEIGTRFYIDSRIVAEALLFIIKGKAVIPHEIGTIDRPLRLNIVGQKSISNLELAQMIAKIMDKELKYELQDFHSANPAHDIHYGLEGSKLEIAGFRPSKDLETCLAEVIKWQQDNPEWIN